MGAMLVIVDNTTPNQCRLGIGRVTVGCWQDAGRLSVAYQYVNTLYVVILLRIAL